ncbi:MAG: hypothetical protein CMJ81_10295 [Planctomycetaceae bacterium]|nr:hypothetical protein [Planctomycetaceae bacterium]MBP60984.1 hypothetical protein [Planctomycetaceae bacterium]
MNRATLFGFVMFLAIVGLTFAAGTNVAQAGNGSHSDEAVDDDSCANVWGKSACCVLNFDCIFKLFCDVKPICGVKHSCFLNFGCGKHAGCCSACDGEEAEEEAPSASEDVPAPPAAESEARFYRGPRFFRFTNIRR